MILSAERTLYILHHDYVFTFEHLRLEPEGIIATDTRVNLTA